MRARALLMAVLLVGCDGSPGADPNANGQLDGGEPLPDTFVGLDLGIVDATSGCEPVDEVCNGADDDCDSLVDDDDPDLQRRNETDPGNCGGCGQACTAAHTATYACRGARCFIASCEPGFSDFNGRYLDGCEADCLVTAGGAERCDGVDNDCDGLTDEETNLQSDPENCGGCGRRCDPVPNAGNACINGECRRGECAVGWHDLDGSAANGCEYECTVRATERVREFCNALDDDCDGEIDEPDDLAPPDEDFCGQNGVCGFECELDEDCPEGRQCNEGFICELVAGAPVNLPCETDADCQAEDRAMACIALVRREAGEIVTRRRCVPRLHQPMCDGQAGYRCVRPPEHQIGNESGRCDGLDNDCDGRVDEEFVNQLFVDGEGRRRPRTCDAGLGSCRREGEVRCTADGSSTECTAEAAEPRRDDDSNCNGLDDDCDGEVDEDYLDTWVRLGAFEIYAYEASRPGATGDAPGLDLFPDDGVVAYVEARACSRSDVLPWANVTWERAALVCEASGARLCTAAEWAQACGGPDGNQYPYGMAYVGNRCNGGANDVDPGTPGVQDAALPAGAMERCVAGGAFDLSGNLKEWIDHEIDGLRPVRGGGFDTNVPAGLTCQQTGDLKPADFRSANLGFRCCRDVQ